MVRKLRRGLVALACLTWSLAVAVSPLTVAASTSTPGDPAPPISSVYVQNPAGRTLSEPPSVLVLLHGMGASGEDFAQDLGANVDLATWSVVSPTIQYGDWRDPAQIAREEPLLMQWLADYVGTLSTPQVPNFPRVYLLGYSRGAQLAHRFTLVYPDRVQAVASVSAGTYTLPRVVTPQGRILPFPFGLTDIFDRTGRAFNEAELQQVQFWTGVGANDTNPADLPRQWDASQGNTRVQRARTFHASLEHIGAPSALTVFPGEGHGFTPRVRAAALTFLEEVRASVRPPHTPEAMLQELAG